MPWSIPELDARWLALRPPAHGAGEVVQVCVRPALDARRFPEAVALSPERGAIGDRWENRTWMHLPDGRPDPRVQVAMMEWRVLEMLQQLTGCRHHPGDTLLVEFDLGAAHLPVGTHVQAGAAVLEISDVENDACAKFAKHYGADVLAWIRAPANRARRLRGVFARVVQGGEVRAGSPLRLRGAGAT